MGRQARTAPCTHEVLAESDRVSIARCTGGTVHLQMGPVTLSLTANDA